MIEKFKLDIVQPDKIFFTNENVDEVILPAVEGEIGILFNHIPIISFLKPGFIRVIINDNNYNFYVDDGFFEFKENTLSILTSKIIDLKNKNEIRNDINKMIDEAKKELSQLSDDDQRIFILNQKLESLNSLN